MLGLRSVLRFDAVFRQPSQASSPGGRQAQGKGHPCFPLWDQEGLTGYLMQWDVHMRMLKAGPSWRITIPLSCLILLTMLWGDVVNQIKEKALFSFLFFFFFLTCTSTILIPQYLFWDYVFKVTWLWRHLTNSPGRTRENERKWWVWDWEGRSSLCQCLQQHGQKLSEEWFSSLWQGPES